MAENPLVSIIIPVYKVESNYLDKCLRSAVNQTYINIEILLIDDDSKKEDLRLLMEEYKQEDSRVKLVHKEQNEGVSYTRKQSVHIANGEYICFLDCDDFLVENCIELLLNEAMNHNADVVIGDLWMTYETFKIYCGNNYDKDEPFGYLKALLTSKCGGTIWAKLIRTEFLRNITYPVFIGKDNDVLINFHIAYVDANIICLKKAVYNWVQRKTSVTQIKSESTVNHTKLCM